MKITIQQIDESIRDLFTDIPMKGVTTLYEKGEEWLKLIIAFSELTLSNSRVLHTKFIFKVNNGKSHLLDNSFTYLYDLNCRYKMVRFESITDMEDKIKDIISDNAFGENIKYLGEFLDSGAQKINFALDELKVKKWSVYNISYEPIGVNWPCNKSKYRFILDLNGITEITLNVKKMHPKEFSWEYSVNDEGKVDFVTNSLENMHSIIANHLKELL